MKRFAVGLMAVLSLCLTNSCKKEEDAKPKDPCAGITCKNGGTCANGLCNCPPGWTGSDCGTQRTPSKITISKIDVLRFLRTKTNGSSWDVDGSSPDIYPAIWDAAGNNIWSGTFIQDPPGAAYSWTLDAPGFDLTSPTSAYQFGVVDEDVGTDEVMGYVSGVIYNSTNRFPTEIPLDAGTGVAFKLYVSYTW